MWCWMRERERERERERDEVAIKSESKVQHWKRKKVVAKEQGLFWRKFFPSYGLVK